MERLKLIAMDTEDLKILSTYCQDSVLKIGDLQYLAAEKRFVLAMNRYVWEENSGMKIPQRRRSVLHFNQVEGVKIVGINRGNSDDVLSLLAVTFEPGEAPSGVLNLVFSGSSTIRLEVECIEVQLSDLDAAWQAKSQPKHKLD